MKVSKSAENREILLKGTTRKITSQEGRFFNFLKRLVTAGLPLIKTVLMPFAKSVLLPLGLLAAIQNNIYRSGTTASINSNEEMQDTMKIVKSLEEPGLLVKRISETIKIERKEQKGGFLLMLLVTLTASLLGSALTGTGVKKAGENF